MFLRFLLLQTKTATRSPIWQKNLALNLVIGFFMFLFTVYLLMLGLFIGQIMNELAPHKDHFQLFNGFLIYYFLGDILIRFLMQSLPALSIESFLHLPIRKGTIIRYMIGRTFFDVFNYLPLFIFIPVTFTIVFPNEGGLHALLWIVTLILLILSNNFLVVYLKRLLGSKPAVVGVLGLALVSLVVLDRMNLISLSVISAKIFGYFTHHPVAVILPVGWMIFTYWLQSHFLLKHLYPDEMQKKKVEEIHERAESRFLKSMGLTGSIISLEFKLYIRNKRTKTILYMAPVFLLYGMLFYPQPVYHNQNGFLLFVGVFMTGGMMLNYANYAFGYESAYFDGLLTKNINFEQYIRVKYYIAVLISTICYILTIPYLYYGYKILLINTAMYLYNIGILSFVLLYFATFNKKRIDLSRGGAFNYQGIGAMNWLAVLPAFILPLLVYLPFKMSGHPNAGIAFTGFLGVLGLFFMRSFIKLITKSFYKRKYIMAASFRER
jgi:hypothetical protein